MSFINPTNAIEPSFDIECYRLAAYFLDDLPAAPNGAEYRDLARTIQQAVEDWLADRDHAAERAAEAAYDAYVDSKIDEMRETGKRPAVLPRKRMA